MPSWKMTGLLLGLRSSHQRIPETSPFGPVPADTDWFVTSDSCAAKVAISKPKQRPLSIPLMIDHDSPYSAAEYSCDRHHITRGSS